jgi:hypothetical protein
MNGPIITAQTDWQAQAEVLKAELERLRQQLVDAEAELADKLKAIHYFEFKLRLRVGHLVRRLDELAAEIKALREQLRQRGEQWDDPLAGNGNGRFHFDTDHTATDGEYRYRDNTAVSPEPKPVDADKSKKLKQLYRQLAFRFHPDMAVDEADREYRTQLMMAINAAYAAGDLEKLEQIALEPDGDGRIDTSNITAELVQALQRELARVKRRLTEIEEEMARLDRHPNVRFMQDTEKAAAEGIDLLDSYESQIRRQISRKMVERDVLQQQLDDLEDETLLGSEDFADTIYNLNLEQAYESDPDLYAEEMIARRNRYHGFPEDEDNPDDTD